MTSRAKTSELIGETRRLAAGLGSLGVGRLVRRIREPRLWLAATLLGCAAVLVGTVMAGYEGHRGWVNYLAVLPGRQRGGLGRALMAAAEDRTTRAEAARRTAPAKPLS